MRADLIGTSNIFKWQDKVDAWKMLLLANESRTRVTFIT